MDKIKGYIVAGIWIIVGLFMAYGLFMFMVEYFRVFGKIL